MKEVIMRCPDCKTIVRGTYGLFNRKFTCTKCYRSIDPKKDANQTVDCNTCGNTIVYDTRVGIEQVCPICSAPLFEHSIADVEVSCPSCHMNQFVKVNEFKHTCAICNTIFDVKSATAQKTVIEKGTASVITVPANNKDIIWKHPMTNFPYASHVVVPEGYTALILKDGIASKPSMPGKYVLSDSIRNMTEQLEYALLDDNAQVFVQIIFIRNQMVNVFSWGGDRQSVTDRDGNIIGSLGFGGEMSLRINDVKKFVEFAGYDTASEEDLISYTNGTWSKVYRFVRDCSFASAHKLMLSSVYNNTFTFKALDSNKLYLQKLIKTEVDRELAAIGVETTMFSVDFIDFQEDDDVKRTRAEEEAKTAKIEMEQDIRNENYEDIRRYVQRLFDWEASDIHVHMKGNQTLSADIVYGGQIKFRITDNVFFQNPEVRNWIKNGVSQKEIGDYCTGLAKVGVNNVLSDILQSMINDTNADIRDLNIYYNYYKQNIKVALSAYFAQEGLAVDLFDFKEKRRTQSVALNAKGEVENHSTLVDIKHDRAQIDINDYAFDKNMAVEKARIDGHTEINLAKNQLDVDRQKTQIAKGYAEDKIDNIYIEQSVKDVEDQVERNLQKKYESWNREDTESQIDYEHYQKLKAYDRAGEISDADLQAQLKGLKHGEIIKGVLHQETITDYQYAEEIARATNQRDVNAIRRNEAIEDAEHHASMNKYSHDSEINAMEHEQYIQDIRYTTIEKMELHYLNQQEIENRAQEMYTQWEANERLQYNELMQQIKQQDTVWAAQKKFTREENALSHELEQSAAENELMINGILRKIAESDMELKEKKDAYSRLLRIQEANDELDILRATAGAKSEIFYNDAQMKNILQREKDKMDYDRSRLEHDLARDSIDIGYQKAKMEGDLKHDANNIFYENGHFRNLLTKEEQDILDEMMKREYLRTEGRKNAEFQRAMKEKEIDTAHEMDKLQLEYSRYQLEKSLQREIEEKDYEIQKLKMLLGHDEKLSEDEIRKMEMKINAEKDQTNTHYDYLKSHDQAEYGYKSDQAKAEYGYKSDLAKAEYGYRSDLAKAEYGYRSDQAKAEFGYLSSREVSSAKYMTEQAKLERESQEKLQRERIDAEKTYMKRADDLLSQMLSIQAAIDKHSFETQRAAIDAGAKVQIAKYDAESKVASHNNDARIKEMEKMIKEMEKNIQSLNKSIRRDKSEKAGKKHHNYNKGQNRGYNNVPPISGRGPSNYTPNPVYTSDANYTPQPEYRSPYSNDDKKKCPYCGSMVNHWEYFCNKCGRKI